MKVAFGVYEKNLDGRVIDITLTIDDNADVLLTIRPWRDPASENFSLLPESQV